MSNKRPVSDLKYYDILRECGQGEPVYLTEQGEQRYVLVEAEEYTRMKNILELYKELSQIDSARKEEWSTIEDLKKRFPII